MKTTIARLLMLGLVVAMTTAFAPLATPARRGSALQFKFLKELGLEKPSWLPDFGGEKEEAKKPSEEDEDAEDTTEEEATSKED